MNSLVLLLTVSATTRIAVLDLKPRVGVSNELAQAVTDDVVAEVRKLLPSAKVVSTDELRSTLKYDLTKRDMGCDVAACLAEIGGALGVEQLVAGTLSKFGSTYLLSLKLIDARTSSVKHQFTKQISAKTDEGLLEAVGPGVRELFPEAALAIEPGAGLVPSTPSPAPAPERADAPTAATSIATATRSPRSSNGWMPVVGWTGVGVSIAALAAGGILLGLAANARSAANADPSSAGLFTKTDRANKEDAAAAGSLIGGGVLLIPSIILLVIHPDPTPQPAN